MGLETLSGTSLVRRMASCTDLIIPTVCVTQEIALIDATEALTVDRVAGLTDH